MVIGRWQNRFQSAAMACLGGLGLAVCLGQDLEVRDELIPLRLKEMERSDRLPATGKKEGSVTRVEVGEAGSGLTSVPGEGWEEEVVADEALTRLKGLLRAADETDVAGFLAEGFRADGLGPGDEAGVVTTAGELLELRRLLGEVQVKIVDVDRGEGRWTTRVKVESEGEDFEHSAIWICEWLGGRPLTLLGVRALEKKTLRYEGPRFADVTCAVLGDSSRFQLQVMRGMEFWAQRITRIGDLSMTGHHGIAVGDVNGDGLEDVYVCDGGSLPNQLYVQQADGTAREVAAAWGVDWLEDSRGALLVDLDNDGDQDLVVATIAMIAFAENEGGEKFVLRGGFPGAPYPFSLSAADFDSDGDLDIYACVYGAADESGAGKRGFEARSPIPFNDAENGGRNVLLANLGGFRFGDVTARAGLDADNTRWSFAASWEDVDRDGDPDLYVANDFGRNCFYRNDGGRFTNVAEEAGVEDMAAGMSVSWGDFNRDGAADLYVGNMFSAAGSRVGGQRNFEDGLQRMARGNSLFAGKGMGFRDDSLAAGVTGGGWAWSSAFADLNNDGWQDLVVANGYLTNTRDDDL
ncbi:MAG: FG-GAP repeat domain-containing protein [Verrucomicrobiaceae bacterium]